MTPEPSAPAPPARHASGATAAHPDWREGWALGLATVLVVAAFSWVPSLWWDEAATRSGATRTLPQLWTMMHSVDAVHGLYYALMHGWVALTGTSAFAMRLPSAVAAGLACVGVWRLGHLLGARRLALSAAVVFALMPRVTWFGAEARSLALTAAVAAWTTVLVVHALRRAQAGRPVPARRTWTTWAAYAVLAGLGIALNIYLALLLAAHAVTALWWLRGRVRQVAWAWLGSAAVALALGAPVLRLAVGQSSELPDVTASVGRYGVQLVVQQYFTGALPTLNQILALPPRELWGWAALGLAALGWAVLVVAALRTRTAAGRPVWAVALPWIVVPVLPVVVYSFVGTPIYAARYFSFTTPAVALLLAQGWLALRGRTVRVVAAVAALVLVLPVYASQRVPTAKHGYDWDAAAAYVAAHVPAGSPVYYSPAEGNASDAYPSSFAGLDDWSLQSTAAASGTLFGVRRSITTVADVPDVDVLWVVETDDSIADRHTVADERAVILAAGFHQDTRWVGTQTAVVRYVRG